MNTFVLNMPIYLGKKDGIEQNYSVPDHFRLDHVPVTQNYPVEEVMLDLLHTAALTLTMYASVCFSRLFIYYIYLFSNIPLLNFNRGGHLVYLLPTTYDFTEEDLPKHPCLKLVEVYTFLLRLY